MKKALTHLSLEATNAGKLARLDAVAIVYQCQTQAYVNVLIARGERMPDKYAPYPAGGYGLSERWLRCAWQQACGVVRSWYSNGHTTPPLLAALCIPANANVCMLEPARTTTFDYWLRLSTLDKGQPVRVPIRLYAHARQALAAGGRLCSGVTLNKQKGRWYATFVIEYQGTKQTARGVIGVDVGMTHIATTSSGVHYGQISARLARMVRLAAQKRQRQQKLNACLKKKGKSPVSLRNNKPEAFARNEIGRALNQVVQTIPPGTAVAVERLDVAQMRLKSRAGNRQLRAAQLGYITRRLREKLDAAGLRYKSVQAAYSSQQCSFCGFTISYNRRSQECFSCCYCGLTLNADHNAALIIAERFGDDALNACGYRDVQSLLATRFMRRLPDGRSPSGLPDTESKRVANSHSGPSAGSPILHPE
jgi:Putative transposase DNA-binding domain